MKAIPSAARARRRRRCRGRASPAKESDDGAIRKAGATSARSTAAEDQADDEQDQRHDQLRVAGVGLLDVVVLGRDAAEQAARGELVQAFADLLDGVGGVARVGVAAEDDDDDASRRRRRSAAPAAPACTVSSFSIPATTAAPRRRPRRPRSAASRSRAGSVRSSTLVPRLELVGSVSPWPNPIVPWWARLPSASTTRSGGDERR